MTAAGKKVQLPTMQTRAAFVPGSFNAEKRTVDVVWSTGARGPRYDWNIGRFYEELSLDPAHVNIKRLNAGASVLNTHNYRDLSCVLGAVVPGSVVVDGLEGRATLLLSEREEVAPILKDIEAGIVRHISVGYNVTRYEHVDNVQEDDGLIPVYRATEWEPVELSFVPIPFDSGAQVRSDEKGNLQTCVFINRSDAANGGTMTKEVNGQPTPAATGAAADEATTAANLRAAEAAGVAAERQRQDDIRVAVRALPEGERAALETEFIGGGVTVDAARAKVIEKLSIASPDIRNVNNLQTQEDERDKWVRGGAEWLVAKSGVIDKSTERKLDGSPFRGLTLMDLARESLERQGVNTRGMDKMQLVGMALTHRGGQNTTSDFAVLLENTMHKILLAAYAVTPDTWTRFCDIGSVSDFRAHNRYLMGTFGALDVVPESGEYKNKSIPDGRKESITAATKGNIINISRQAIINDDMGAFTRVITMLGRAAKLSVEVDVYAALALNSGLGPLLSDAKTLFHADHGNIGTGAALSVASFDADRVVMASQKDISGNEILDLRPEILLLPIGLGGAARVINQAQYDVDVSNKFQVPNKVVGMYRDIVDTARMTGTRRYSFASPSVAPVLEVAFLDGQQEPVLETKDGWRVDGTEMKVRLDYAVGAVGYLGAVTNAGA